MFKSFCLSLTLLFSGCLAAQNRIAVSPVGGFIIAHRTPMQRLVTGHTTGIELNLEKTANGNKNWHHDYAFPWTGLSVQVLDLGNSRQLGTAIGLTPYLRLPLTSSRNLNLKLGFGLGYLSKHYERIENQKNTAIGSNINISACVGFWQRIGLSKNMALQAGLQLQHFSNGAFRTPNLGINVPMFSLGLLFGRNDDTPTRIPTASEKQTGWYLSSRFGLKELMQTGHKLYPTFALHLSRMQTISQKFSYTLFSDVFYNSSTRTELEAKGINNSSDLDNIQFGLGSGLENTYGKFAIYAQMGAYLLSKDTEIGRFYHRFGIKRQFTDKQYINFGLKSHFAKADYLELGWGIKL